MIVDLVLAACLTAPLFNQGDGLRPCADENDPGPCVMDCSAARAEEECGCSEWISWAPVPEALWYEIRRTDSFGISSTWSTRPWNHAAYVDEDGNDVPEVPIAVWHVGRDPIGVPLEGERYTYAVRACFAQPDTTATCGGVPNPTGAPCCGDWSAEIPYIGAPYEELP